MKQTVRFACSFLTLLFCLPLSAQDASEKKRADGVITTEEMQQRLATVESDGSVITTDKLKERLENAAEGGVITNSTLSTDEAAAAARAGAFTNADLGSTGESETGDEADADEATRSADEAEPSTGAPAEPDSERERMIAEIESELDALAERVRGLQDESDDTRIRETESKIEELRRAVDALKQGA